MEKMALKVEGMTCNHCKTAVEQALRTLPGVSAAEVDLNAKEARVSYDPGQTSASALRQAVVDAGYEVK